MNPSEGILIVVILVLIYVAYQKYTTEGFSVKTSCAAAKPGMVGVPVPQFAQETFTAEQIQPPLDWKDYAASQAIDESVVKNHREYIRDQEANNLLGGIARTSKIRAEQEPYADVPWMGLRPPRMVNVDNPLQVAEYHSQNYVNGPIRLT